MSPLLLERRGGIPEQWGFSKQLPSFNEGFGSLSRQATPPSSVRCPTCEAAGHIVFLYQGTTCSHCNISKRLTPPPDLPNHLSDPSPPGPTTRYGIIQLPQAPTEIETSRRSSLVSPSLNLDYDSISQRTIFSLPVPPHNNYSNNNSSNSSNSSSPISSSPHTMSTILTSFHPYPQPNPPTMQQYHINTHSEWRPVVQRSEKDTRHCDAEKARRDHQSAYIDLGFSLRTKFRWPQDLDAISPSQPAITTHTNAEEQSPTSSFSSTVSNTPTITADPSGEPKDKPIRREKLTKQTKLHQQVLWEFRACLRIDKDRVREWLDEVREQGQELRRKKREVMDYGRGSSHPGTKGRKIGKEVRCSKDEAVLEVWEVMEREFWEFCCLEEVGGSTSKRRRTSDDMDYANE